MITRPETPPTIDERLAQLAKESAALEISRTRAQQEADACVARMQLLAQRISAIQVATTALAGLAPLAPEQEWLDHLNAWHRVLSDELAALPAQIRTDHELGTQQNLELSILVIDQSLAVVNGTGYALHTLRLGELMRAAGYEPVGANRDRNYGGELPWFGSRPDVERRIANLQKERQNAQARLDEALLDDAERERLAAASKARRDALNAAPQRRTRGDGSHYDSYPDGRMVEVTT